jgi:hypothetical protein
VHVSCQLVRHNGAITGTRCKATVALTSGQAAVAVRLSRGSTVYALGKGVARTRHTTFALRQRHVLKNGRYALSIVVTRHGRARTATSSVAVR